MRCPTCKEEIVSTKKKRIQTLSEHVFNPNQRPSLKPVFECVNKECPLSSKDIFWDYDGDRYGGFDIDNETFIGKNDAPFGSISRKTNVEIHKVGLEKSKEIFSIGKYKFELEYKYSSNKNGDVLDKKYKLNIWVKDEKGKVKWTNPFRMISFTIGDYFRSKKRGALDLSTFYHPYSGWWRRVSRFILKYPLLQYKYFAEYEKS